MIVKKRMRRFTVYFRDGTAQPFVLEPEDTIAYGLEKGVPVIELKMSLGDEQQIVTIEREAVAMTRHLTYTIEVDDSPKPKLVVEPEPEGIEFRG